MDTNVIKLHTKQLKIDDQIHNTESYWDYWEEYGILFL